MVEIAQEQILLRNSAGKTWALKNDFVFAMTGYRPDLEFFKALGIHLNPADQRPVPQRNV